MNLKKVLENYGLTEKQASVYLACLEMDSASVYRISKKVRIPRSTCYEVLEDLKEMGLVTTFRRKKVLYYAAEDLKIIINSTKEKIKELESALPEFSAMFGSSKLQPTVRFYQGQAGMKTILEEILNEATYIKGFVSAVDQFAVLGSVWPQFLKKRIGKKIKAMIIMTDSEKAQERKRLGEQELRQVKIMPKQYKHHVTMFICKRKTAIFSYKKEMMALVIESEEFSQAQEAIFDFNWDMLPE